jgi:hypothetical protein
MVVMPKTAMIAPSLSYQFLPPTRGWIVSEPLANSKPGGARVLENWFPTQTSARLRGGSRLYATVSTGPVLRMWTYKSGAVEQFFASDLTNIFNITTVANPAVIPTPVVTGQTSGYYSTAQLGTAGGNYLSVVNGTDTPKTYDGTTWANHAFTVIPDPKTLSFVWTFGNRLWYVQKNTMNAWYLPVTSINGALTQFSLAGVFQNGGSLLFGGKWSMDAGNGLDDKCVFVSTTGEVVIYQGTDPSTAATWSKVGLYQITPPVGPNATMSAGGDLLIATEDGIVPISQAVQKDAAALSLSAVTKNIQSEWKKEVIARKTLPFEIIKWPTFNMAVVSLPVPDVGIAPYCFVANLETGAWCKYTNWETRSIALYSGYGYFGNNTGKVFQMEVGGNDNGLPYTCTYVGLPEHLRTLGVQKYIHSARSIFLSNVPFKAKISASMNYNINLPTPPSSVANYTTDEWDSALWDVAKWDSSGTGTVKTQWVSIGKNGFVVSPQIQITNGVTPYPRTELIAFDVLFERGGIMT